MAQDNAPSVDWSMPLVAVPTKRFRGGPLPRALIDKTYHREPNYVPVRLDRNIWTNSPSGGTWYFTDDGLAIGAHSADGYDGQFTVANA